MAHRTVAGIAVGIAIAFVVLPALARPRGIPFEPGNLLAGQISSGEAEDTFLFDALAGSLFDASVAGDKAGGLFPAVALLDPEGVEIDLTGHMQAKGPKASLKKVPLPDTGRYALVISGASGTSGGYVVKTKIKVAKAPAIAPSALAPYARRDLPIPGVGGAAVSFALAVTSGSTPAVPDVFDPDGQPMAGDWAGGLASSPTGIKGRFTLAGPLGTYGLRLENDSDQTVEYVASVSVKLPKAARATVSATDPEPRVTTLSKVTAFAGDTLTVYGTGFAAGCGVWFGDVASPWVSFVHSGEVLAEVPDCQGLLPVGVENPDGQENPLPDAISVSGPAIIEFLFPPANGLTDGDSLHVSGRSKFVAALAVNGVPATFEPDGRTFDAVVPLAPGENGLTLSGTTVDGVPFVGIGPVATITRTGAIPVNLDGIAADLANGRAFLSDEAGQQILAVDLASGWRTLVSSALRGTGVADFRPTHLAFDAVNGRVLCTDPSLGLIGVDIATGNRTVLSSNTVGSGPLWSRPAGVAVNAAGTLAYVGAESGEPIYSVNLASGARTVVSGSAVGAGPAIAGPMGMVLDAGGTHLLVGVGGGSAVMSVELSTGDRVVVSSYEVGVGPTWSRPLGLALDAGAGRLYVADEQGDALYVVDLASGNRTVVSRSGTGTGPLFQSPTGVAIDPGTGVAFVTDRELDAVFAVATGTGNRTVRSDWFRGTGTHFVTPGPLALNPAADKLFVGEISGWMVYTVDVASGARALLADENHGTGGFFEPVSLLFDSGENRLLVGSSYSLLAMDISNGNRTVLSGSSVGTGPDLMYLQGLCEDSTTGSVLATTAHQQGVFAIALAGGDRTVVSDNSAGTGPSWYSPRGVVHDAARDRFLVSDSNNNTVLAVDRGSGDRFPLSGWGAGWGPDVESPRGICLAGGSAVVANAGGGNLLLVDPDSGDRTVLSGRGVGAGPLPSIPEDVVLWPGGHAVAVSDARLNAVLVVHLRSGDRLVLSK